MKDTQETRVDKITMSCTNDVEALVQARLRESPYLELRRLRCDFQENTLRLKGRVSSYYLRQLALAAARGLEGVEAIESDLEVVPA